MTPVFEGGVMHWTKLLFMSRVKGRKFAPVLSNVCLQNGTYLGSSRPGRVPLKQHPASLCCLTPQRLCPMLEVIRGALFPPLGLVECAARQLVDTHGQN